MRMSSKQRWYWCQLPNEIVVSEVLSRLPVKSLLRFKSVCKAWRALISDPEFIQMHLIKHQSQASSSGRIICNGEQLNILFGYSHDLYSMVFKSSDADATKLDYDPRMSRVKWPYHHVSRPGLWGSCNGLICVEGEEHVLGLLNPSIRSYRELPLCPIDHPNGAFLVSISTYGFGYDANIKDYKLVRVTPISFKNKIQNQQFHSQVQVFTLGTNSWRRISDTVYKVWEQAGKFVDGALYWKVVGLYPNKVVSFDIQDEVFRELTLPDVFLTDTTSNSDKKCTMDIAELGGCLALVRHVCKSYDIVFHEVWVMKENWIKMYSIKIPSRLFNQVCPLTIPLGSIDIIRKKKNKKNHVEIVFAGTKGYLLSYNPNTNRFRRFRVHGVPELSYKSIVTYVESLVLLD